MGALIIRIVKQIINDKRTLALIIIVPVLMITLLYLLLGESTYKPVIGLAPGFNAMMRNALEEQNVTINSLSEDADADEMLRSKEIDAYISSDMSGINIRMLEPDTTKTSKITNALKKAAAKLNPAGSFNMSFIFGKTDRTLFDSSGYIIIGFLSFFFVFIISGISFVRERTSGTMERLMLTPVSRFGVVAGYTVGFGIFAAVQSILVIIYTRYVLHMDYEGQVWIAIVIMVLLSFTAVSLGALVSIFANTEFQVMQFIPVIIVPQFFFSGLMPIETIPYGLGKLAYIMPVYYGNQGLKGVLTEGRDLAGSLRSMGMLAAFIIVFLLINTMALKKYRRI